MSKENLQEELKQSMLAKNTEKTSVLRMLLSAIGYYEIHKGGAGYVATDEDVITILQREVKQRKDSIEQFKNANRQDLVDKEQKELVILTTYLPAQMSEEQITDFVKKAIQQTGATTMQDIGKVMGALMPQTRGKADGTLVNQIVKKILEGN